MTCINLTLKEDIVSFVILALCISSFPYTSIILNFDWIFNSILTSTTVDNEPYIFRKASPTSDNFAILKNDPSLIKAISFNNS